MIDMTNNPSNQDILEHIDRAIGDHARDDKDFQREINTRMKSLATKEEIGAVVALGIEAYFKTKGKTAYAGLLIIASIITALVVIGGGAKALLGWFGFTYILK